MKNFSSRGQENGASLGKPSNSSGKSLAKEEGTKRRAEGPVIKSVTEVGEKENSFSTSQINK